MAHHFVLSLQTAEATLVSSSRVGSACGRATQWRQALFSTWLLDAVCFNVVISALSKGNQWLKAVDLLKQMESKQLSPDEISYNAAISGCESWRMSLALLSEMKEVRSSL